MSDSGFLLTFEGGEGGGKTSQIARLRTRLARAGKAVEIVREPGGTVISEQIRDIVLSTRHLGMDYAAEVLLFQAARAQVYSEVVLPSLAAGKVVLMDRSRDSSVVYQGVVRGFGKDLVEQLNDISTKKTYPDLTILLDLPPKIGLDRQVKNGEIQRFEMEALDFHEQVRAAYLALAKTDTKRWVVLDATQSIDEVEAAIWKVVAKKFHLQSKEES